MLDKILGIIEIVKCPTKWCIIWLCYIDNLMTQFFFFDSFLRGRAVTFHGHWGLFWWGLWSCSWCGFCHIVDDDMIFVAYYIINTTYHKSLQNKQHNNTTIHQHNDTTTQQHNNATTQQHKNTPTQQYNNTTINQCNNTRAWQHNKTTI